MASVTLLDGRCFDIPDGDPQLAAYYVGEGGTVEPSGETVAAVFPRVFTSGEPTPAKSAVKGDWVDRAVEFGADRDEAEAMTKDQLVAFVEAKAAEGTLHVPDAQEEPAFAELEHEQPLS